MAICSDFSHETYRYFPVRDVTNYKRVTVCDIEHGHRNDVSFTIEKF